jgi:DICT domain-containing protein
LGCALRSTIPTHSEETTIVDDATTGFSIGELARRTGVPAGTLRSWERRYGVPHPGRAVSGHRRYSAADVELVLDTVRHRSSGLPMPMAVERARSQQATVPHSVYAGLRHRHPALRVQSLTKPAVVALCRAIEDECCMRAEQPVLFAGFQQERHFRASEKRWTDLSRTARTAVVVARFERTADSARPVRLRLPETSALDREWILVCDAPDHPGCVVGWERPGQAAMPDPARRFETLWSVDPQVVRDAARLFASAAEQLHPGVCADVLPLLEQTPPPPSPQTLNASAVLDRMLEYVAAAAERGLG